MTSLTELRQELHELAVAPYASSQVLERAIWGVVNGVVERDSPDCSQLLDDTRPLVERLASHPDLERQNGGPIPLGYVSTKSLRCNWDILSAYAHTEPVTTKLRAKTCRNLGSLTAELTENTFELDRLDTRDAQRVCQVATLHLLQRNSRVFGLPSDPRRHNPGRHRRNTTFNIHAWSASQSRLIPLAVQKLVYQEAPGEPRFREVLLIGLGDLAYGAAAALPELQQVARPEGQFTRMKDAKRRLADHAIRTLALDAGSLPTSEQSISRQERQWLGVMTGKIARLVNSYRPPGERT